MTSAFRRRAGAAIQASIKGGLKEVAEDTYTEDTYAGARGSSSLDEMTNENDSALRISQDEAEINLREYMAVVLNQVNDAFEHAKAEITLSVETENQLQILKQHLAKDFEVNIKEARKRIEASHTPSIGHTASIETNNSQGVERTSVRNRLRKIRERALEAALSNAR